MPAYSVTLEVELSGEGNGWTDLSADLVGSEKLRYGLPGTGILDRVASTGTLNFALDNSSKNSAGLIGRYSPNHANCLTGFKLGIRCRYSVLIGATRYYKHLGTIDDITPTAGIFEDLTSYCTSVDYIDDLARANVDNIDVQINKRSDELFDLLLDTMDRQPAASEIQQGLDEYPYALDDVKDESTKVLSAMADVAMSELGLVYVKGDTTQGGTLVFESRAHRPGQTTFVDTFLDTKITNLVAGRRRMDAVNAVNVETTPRRLGTSATTVLYSLKSVLEIAPGTPVTLLGPYIDELNGNRVGAKDFVDPPTTPTDYLMNTQADGLGSDVSADLTVSANFGGNGIRWTLTNNNSNSCYITKLQARGRPIFTYDKSVFEATDADSITQHGKNLVPISMKYQSDPRVGAEAAYYLVNLYKDPLTKVQSVQFYVPNSDATLAQRVIAREISERIGIQETVTGLETTLAFFINSVDIEVDENENMWVSWALAPADVTAYWLLEIAGRSELDQTTRLGFGLIVGHTDIAHGDVHTDVAHSDIPHQDTAHTDTHTDDAHADSAHTDTAHEDVAHSDSHSDTAHTDAAHSDVAHSDSHSDIAHTDGAHGDLSHNDTAHNDISHGDVAHTDTAHGDSHNDEHFDANFHEDFDDSIDPHEDHGDFGMGHDDEHTDTHSDSAHADVSHSDVAHTDVAHSDRAHTDSHSDVAHSDAHTDVAHTDTAHGDVAHSDVAHSDVAHTDVAHVDVGHSDAAHGDVAHSDTAHVDVDHSDDAHSDAHTDSAHGDIN